MKFTRKTIKGISGMNIIEKITLDAGCKCIPIPQELDSGIDGFIEFVQGESATGKLIAFQVKCGKSYFKNNKPYVQTNEEHIKYWRQYSLPVILFVISEDGHNSYWMDIKAYANKPQKSPYLLKPPIKQTLTSDSLLNKLLPTFSCHINLGDAISLLCDPSPIKRLASLGMLWPLAKEQYIPFIIAAAIKVEKDPKVLAQLCDFYSRYFSHPESSFSVNSELSEYATSILSELSDPILICILESFVLFNEDSSLDATTEIFNMSPDEIWCRHDIVQRGTVQQGIAEVLRVCSTQDTLIMVIEDSSASKEARQASIAIFGYLGYKCQISKLNKIFKSTKDEVIKALLYWLMYWIKEDESVHLGRTTRQL